MTSTFLRRAARWSALVLALAAVGCGTGPADDPVLATVDGLELTRDAFLRSYIDYLVSTGQNDTAVLRRRHFEALVDAYLLGAEADRLGVDEDSAVQAAADLARRRLVGSEFYESTVIDTMAALSEAEVRTAFRLGSEQRVVRQLYFTDANTAEAAYARIEAGRPFLEEAWDLYDTRDSAAGQIGAVSYWQLDDAFAEAAFGTPVGEVSRPVRSRHGYHVLYVEDALRNPLLTEAEFQRRREGVEERLRLRRRRLVGDTFVRDFMAERNVAVNRPALVALTEAVDALEGDPLPDAQQGPGDRRLTAGESAEVLGAFRPSTPLATFTFGGETRTFTLADYVFWLDALPPSEARERTGASLGRALRNEALALAGEAAGVADRPTVRADLARQSRLRLADALRVRLRGEAAERDTARLGDVAARLGVDTRRTVVDFWAVPFPSREAAQAALADLERSPEAVDARPDVERFEGVPLADVPAFAAAVRAAPLGRVSLASVGEGWAVIRVADRRTEVAASGAEAIAPFAAEADLIRRLRAERPVKIDDEALAEALRPPPLPRARRRPTP